MGPKKHIAKKNSGAGSSSRPTQSHYQGRFISREREDRYNRDFKNRSIAKGKIVDLPLLSKGSFFVGNRIRALGWDRFIGLRDNFYPELMREFYANLEYDTTTSSITSKVSNILISLTIPELRALIDLPSDNLIPPPVISNTWHDLTSGTGFDNRTDLAKLLTNTSRGPLVEPPEYNRMNLNSRIMQNLVTYNILPHTGSKTYVTRYGSFIIHCIHSGTRLDLAVMIFRHMLSATEKANQSLPYPSLLTLLFTHFNIGLRGQVIERYTSLDNLDAACIKKMGYQVVDEEANTWILKTGEPDIHDGTWDPNAPQASTSTPSASRPYVRRRLDSPVQTQPESSSASHSWESRIYDQIQANHEAHMASLASMMGNITSLSDNVNSLSNSFQSFRTDTSDRFDYLEDRLKIWDERFDEFYADDAQDGGDDDMD